MPMSTNLLAILILAEKVFTNTFVTLLSFYATWLITSLAIVDLQRGKRHDLSRTHREKETRIVCGVSFLQSVTTALLRRPGTFWLGLTLVECNIATLAAIVAFEAGIIASGRVFDLLQIVTVQCGVVAAIGIAGGEQVDDR